MPAWKNIVDIRKSASALDSVRFAAKFPSAVLVSLEIGGGPLKPTEEGRGPSTMHHLRNPASSYAPSVLRFSQLERPDRIRSPIWISIGRTSDNDVSINDYAVSRRHARLRHLAEVGYIIEDLGSRNGTALNGRWLEPRQQTPISSGQALRFGRLGFTFLNAEDFHTFLVTLVPLE